VQLFYFISCFCIDKIQKNQISNFFPCFWFSVESLEFWPGTVRSNAGHLRSNALGHFPAQSACLRSPDTPLRASARPCFKPSSAVYVRTHIHCVRTYLQILLYIYVAAVDRRSCARAHLSCCSSRPEVGMCSIFLFFLILFNYLFVYLFILPLFIYLLVVFSF
jgi:hypothetical protein